MNFSDERYVRFYTRATLGWRRLGWQGRCILPLLLRRAYHDEKLATEEFSPTQAAVLYTGGPQAFVEVGVAQLLELGFLTHRESYLTFPIQNELSKRADERYVRLFVRDTTTWHRLAWEGQCMLPQLLRSVDRSGVLDTGDSDAEKAATLHTGAPADFVAQGIAMLRTLGVIELRAGALVFPKFLEAQETPKSDRLRQRECRERRRLTAGLRTLAQASPASDVLNELAATTDESTRSMQTEVAP